MASRHGTLRVIIVGVLLSVMALTALVRPLTTDAALVFSPEAPGFTQELVVGGLPYATTLDWAPDGRMFVGLKSGIVRVVENGSLRATPFVDISALVNDNHDRGMLDIAVHPDFPTTPYVYLLYTHDPPGAPNNGNHGRVAQLMRVAADPAQDYNVALADNVPDPLGNPDARVILLGTNSTYANIGNITNGRDITKASCMEGLDPNGAPIEDCIPADENSHTIGTVAFAPDGSLFISNGDGSNYTGVDPRALRSQNLDSLAGKMLRIDPLSGLALAGNPFFDHLGDNPDAQLSDDPTSNRAKVWAYGLRNPFRVAIHPLSGEPYIGDVGWSKWEEINLGKGANFGWPCYEGAMVRNQGNEGGNTISTRQASYETGSTTSAACQQLYNQGLGVVQRPLFTYSHTNDGYGSGGGASANAGAFYQGTAYPSSYRNALFILDYNRKWIRYLTFDDLGNATVRNFAKENVSGGPVQVLTGPDTNLYVVMYNGNGSEVRRIRYTAGGNTPPTAVVNASPTIGVAPFAVQFDSIGSFDPDAQPLNYSWDFGDGTSSTEANPSHSYTASGVYDAVLTLTEASEPFASGSATVRITVGNNPPLATINSPLDGSSYRVGDTIVYSGSGSAGGIPIDPSQLSWELRLHHNEHNHYNSMGSGSGGTFEADDHGDSTYYEICLTVNAPGDVQDTRCVATYPQKTAITLASVPVGMEIIYQDEGYEVLAPGVINPIVGSTQTIAAPSIQRSHTFVGWSDGLANAERSFVVGETAESYTAIYENRAPLPQLSTSGTTNGYGPLTVNFDAAGSSDPEGDTLSYLWDFGDGTTETVSTPQHSFTARRTGRGRAGRGATRQAAAPARAFL
ncbi:PKD domain-containing protein [Candidatus Gracilibacteria bacterium]|nr:PKD domain-containing protein [Candidatus Gracilibacteria bacterium]